MRVTVQRMAQARGVPGDDDFVTWASAAAPTEPGNYDVSIRIVNEDESRLLNGQYRQQDKPTNVLSFPAQLDESLSRLLQEQGDPKPLGDLVICAPLVAREAKEQGKPLRHHWAHLVVHGLLHLSGFDHIRDEDAQVMEARERDILAELGFPDPYRPC
jgi:probable rRNA maturation factor